MSVQWDGAKLTGFLNELQSNSIPKAIEETLLEVAQEAVEQAQSLAPVDTGRLRDSIRILEQGSDYVIIGSDVEYAIFVEFGTYKMAAQPYLGPAADAIPTRFQQVFAQKFNSLLPSI